MNRPADFQDQLARLRSGDPWYGPPIAEVLEGIPATRAAAHPIPGAHSIWELVLHMTAWVREVERRLREGVARDPAEGDWPVPEGGAAAWKRDVAALLEAHDRLQRTVAGLADETMDQLIGVTRDRPLGSGVSRGVTLHGLLQHDAYHLGQISLLKRAQPER